MVKLLAFYFYFDSLCATSSAVLVSEVFFKAFTFTSSENFRVTSPLLLMGDILRVTIFFSVIFVSLLFVELLIDCLIIGLKLN